MAVLKAEVVRLVAGYSDRSKLKIRVLDPTPGVAAEDLDQVLFGHVVLDIADAQAENDGQDVGVGIEKGFVQSNEVSAYETSYDAPPGRSNGGNPPTVRLYRRQRKKH